MNPQKTTIAILAALSVSLALADDFKTIAGKEYKDATVTHVFEALDNDLDQVTTTTCTKWGTISINGNQYIYQQNEWNSNLTQCALVGDTTGAWTITQANFNLLNGGPPATYPSIFRGCHWGNCSSNSGLPIQVSALGRATSSWSTTQVSSGAYDVAYDLWTNTTPTTSGQPNGSEIMIWLNSRGGIQPAGQIVGTASISGATWNVWTTRMSGWNYIAYQRSTGTTSVVTSTSTRSSRTA